MALGTLYRQIEPSERMVHQELPMSCGAACVRQLLLDDTIDVPEVKIRELAGFDPQFGITLDALRDALNELHTSAKYSQGAVFPEQIDALARAVPFIALLRTPSQHFVIVDEIGPKAVHVRDPAGASPSSAVGAAAVMDRDVFVERWTRAFNGVVFRCS